MCAKYGLYEFSPESAEKVLAEIIIRAYHGQDIQHGGAKIESRQRALGNDLMTAPDFVDSLKADVPEEELFECIVSSEMHRSLIRALKSAGKDIKKIRTHYRVLIDMRKFGNNVIVLSPAERKQHLRLLIDALRKSPGDYLLTMEQSLDFLEKGLSVL